MQTTVGLFISILHLFLTRMISFACEHFITLAFSYVTLNVCKYFFLDTVVKATAYTLQCPFKFIACLAGMDLSCE